MALTDMQACLVRLYTEPLLQDFFFADPGSILRHYDLSAAEEQALRQLDPEQMRRFALSLRAGGKRYISANYPLFAKLAEDAFNRCYHRFHALHRISEAFVSEQSLAFGLFADQYLADRGEEPAVVVEVVRYERQRLLASLRGDPSRTSWPGGALDPDARPMPAAGVSIEAYAFDILAVARAIRAGAALPVPAATPLDLLVFLPPMRARPQAIELNVASRQLIGLCNGISRVRDIARAGTGGSTSPAHAARALEQWASMGIIDV